MANTMTLIASSTVGAGGASTIDFSSIPQTYTDLVLKVSARSSYANPWVSIGLKFNGASAGAAFTWREIDGSGTAVVSGNGNGDIYAGDFVGSTATANTFSNVDIYIPNYTSSNYKSVSTDSVTENNSSTSVQLLSAGLWSSTAAITSLSMRLYSGVSGTISQYSTAYLYGISKS
jgi:hypothetical protein